MFVSEITENVNKNETVQSVPGYKAGQKVSIYYINQDPGPSGKNMLMGWDQAGGSYKLCTFLPVNQNQR